MSAKTKRDETFKQPNTRQQQLANANHSDTAYDAGISQPHNAKKEGLGPNTKR